MGAQLASASAECEPSRQPRFAGVQGRGPCPSAVATDRERPCSANHSERLSTGRLKGKGPKSRAMRAPCTPKLLAGNNIQNSTHKQPCVLSRMDCGQILVYATGHLRRATSTAIASLKIQTALRVDLSSTIHITFGPITTTDHSGSCPSWCFGGGSQSRRYFRSPSFYDQDDRTVLSSEAVRSPSSCHAVCARVHERQPASENSGGHRSDRISDSLDRFRILAWWCDLDVARPIAHDSRRDAVGTRPTGVGLLAAHGCSLRMAGAFPLRTPQSVRSCGPFRSGPAILPGFAYSFSCRPPKPTVTPLRLLSDFELSRHQRHRSASCRFLSRHDCRGFLTAARRGAVSMKPRSLNGATTCTTQFRSCPARDRRGPDVPISFTPFTMTQSKEPVLAHNSTKPVKTFRLRGVSVSVFKNHAKTDDRDVSFHKVSVQRTYRDGDEWKTTTSFSRDDLPIARLLLDRAWQYILDTETVRSRDTDDE